MSWRENKIALTKNKTPAKNTNNIKPKLKICAAKNKKLKFIK